MAPRVEAAQSMDHPLPLSTWLEGDGGPQALSWASPVLNHCEKQGWWLSSLEQEEWERPVAGRQSTVIVSGSSTGLERTGIQLGITQNLSIHVVVQEHCLSSSPTNLNLSTLTLVFLKKVFNLY